MPFRFALSRRLVPPLGLYLSAFAWLCTPLAGQEELPLLRDYPGSGRYQCPAPDSIPAPPEEDLQRAAQVASDATQAMALGEFERSQELLGQATELDPTSADYAYRHARALEEVGDADHALEEYCRALDLNVEDLGVFDARDRIDALYDEVRERIPVEAREAFIQGLGYADAFAFERAVESFSAAIASAPDWGAPIYNRGVVYERLGQIQQSLADYRRYLELAPTDIDPLLVVVSERIGELQGLTAGETPNPAGALALGLVPGMGHYYSGRPIGGTVTLVTAGGALAAGLLFKKVTTRCLDGAPSGGVCPADLVVSETTERPYLWYGIGTAAAVTIGGAIEALVDARRRRAEAERIMGSVTDSGEGRDDGPVLELPSVSTSGSRVDLNLLTLRFR